MFPILPIPPTASNLPSWLKAALRMPPMECRLCRGSQVYITGASSVFNFLPVATSHTTMCPTLSAVTSHLPSREKETAESIEG